MLHLLCWLCQLLTTTEHNAFPFLVKLAWCIQDDNTTFLKLLYLVLYTGSHWFIWFMCQWSEFSGSGWSRWSVSWSLAALCVLTSNSSHSMNCGSLCTVSHSAGIFGHWAEYVYNRWRRLLSVSVCVGWICQDLWMFLTEFIQIKCIIHLHVYNVCSACGGYPLIHNNLSG